MVDPHVVGVLDVVAVVGAEGGPRLVGHRELEVGLEHVHRRDALVLEIGPLDGAAGIHVAEDHRRPLAAPAHDVGRELLGL